MRAFYHSTTGQFGLFILFVMGLVAGFHLDPGFTWKDWADLGKWLLGIYGVKESARYGADAYKGANNERPTD